MHETSSISHGDQDPWSLVVDDKCTFLAAGTKPLSINTWGTTIVICWHTRIIAPSSLRKQYIKHCSDSWAFSLLCWLFPLRLYILFHSFHWFCTFFLIDFGWLKVHVSSEIYSGMSWMKNRLVFPLMLWRQLQSLQQ